MSTSPLPQRDAFHVYDTTLRDGAQREGISYSVVDKLAVARLLDDYGVGFIEGGWPGALPKDTEFFARAQSELSLTYAQLVAFGATRKAGVAVAEDQQVRALLDSGAPVITLVAKSDVWHVEQALKTSLDENESMIRDTVDFLIGEGRRVFVDMEHFFDGYKHDPDYGVRLLVAAAESGADVGVLCDTNGGMLPLGIAEIVADVAARSGVRLGIHCQDDTASAVANTVTAVASGVTHVQCTANGYGERTLVSEFPCKGRGAMGVIGIQTSDRNGAVVGAAQVIDDDDLLLITNGGTMVRTPCQDISLLGRNTQGVTLIRLTDGEQLVRVDAVAEPPMEPLSESDTDDGEIIDGSDVEMDDESAD